jgi:hypothetical protein
VKDPQCLACTASQVRRASLVGEAGSGMDEEQGGSQIGLPQDVSPLRLFGPSKGHVLTTSKLAQG